MIQDLVVYAAYSAYAIAVLMVPIAWRTTLRVRSSWHVGHLRVSFIPSPHPAPTARAMTPPSTPRTPALQCPYP